MAKIFVKKFESRSWPSDGLIEQAILNEDSKLLLETETYGITEFTSFLFRRVRMAESCKRSKR